ncbi:hypothetical protein [Pontibacter russatus]|uniref:hypothetical protein n=1 Tax=Pontibacter russatus TaxID=2694929 RepID=UPI0013799F74|nr:hypothetical protein [Pontibacter russatus]
MKKNLLLLITLLLSTAGYAQHMGLTDDGLDEVLLAIDIEGPAMANLEMKQVLQLDPEQYSQVERLNEARYQKMLEAEQLYAQNEVQRSKTFRSIAIETDQTLKQVLDEQQMRRYLELEGRFNTQFVSENEEK